MADGGITIPGRGQVIATDQDETVGLWVPGGIRIGRGTTDRIVSRVNDDLTGLTEFTVRIHGHRHYP